MTSLSDFATLSKKVIDQPAVKAEDIAKTADYLSSLTLDIDPIFAMPSDLKVLVELADTADLRATVTNVAVYIALNDENSDYSKDLGLPISLDECREISSALFNLSDVLRTAVARAEGRVLVA